MCVNFFVVSLGEFTITPRVAIAHAHTHDQRPGINSPKLVNSPNQKIIVLKLGVETS